MNSADLAQHLAKLFRGDFGEDTVKFLKLKADTVKIGEGEPYNQGMFVVQTQQTVPHICITSSDLLPAEK